MATESRAENPGLTEESFVPQTPVELALRDDPCSFEFFQAVTLLHRLRKEQQPVGRFSNPEDEAVQFRVHNTLVFPASEIQEIAWEEGRAPQMAVNFMGLTGPQGVLPYCYTELLVERLRAKDRSLQEFLDIFNHRMLSFFYRAWEKYRFPVTYYLGDEDLFTQHLLDLIGIGTPGLQDRQAVPDQALLHYTALFAMQSRSALALEQILSDYFDVPVEVEQFAGAWYRLDQPEQCCMEDEESQSQQLGLGAVVGDEVWNQQSRARIRIGPMKLERYLDFLPQGSAFAALRALAKFFSHDEIDFEVQLVLEREEVPGCEIGSAGDAAPQLGWVTWMKSKPFRADAGDAVLAL